MREHSPESSFFLRAERMLLLVLAALLLVSTAHSQQSVAIQSAQTLPTTEMLAGGKQQEQQTGSISGKVVDQSGAEIAGAIAKLTQEGQSPAREVTTDEYGLFAFIHVPAGSFQLTISSPGLSSQEFSGAVQPGEAFVTPLFMLIIPTQVTEVRVALTKEQVAEAQVKEQEKQRVLGVIPNFYVTYDPHPAPLPAKYKFELAWKSASDPITVAGISVLAGIDQVADRWGAYGQGAQGYAKRFGATYANVFASTFIGGAVMPTVLKQDPRYFYKGTGTKRSRILRALSNSVMCKGDNGHWQPNYSNMIGSFAGAGLQAAYLPANDRQGAGFVVSSALIRLGETSIAGILQEFVLPKLTPNHATRSRR
jgi:hypothetical protein